ncbi:MAG TPA: hypothetical protein VGD60_00160 [Candidatus Acidoferrales bacterium]
MHKSLREYSSALILTAGLTAVSVAGPLLAPARAQAPAKPTAPVMEPDASAALLESGYRHLYELNFAAGRKDFQAYQKLRPDDPMGKASEAASYLFEQFNQKGVLTSEFFLSDEKFLGGVEGSAATNKNAAFLEANNAAREQAKARIKANSKDVQGLLVLTIADGMESDYDAIIIKKQLDGLSMMRHAEAEANAVLAIDPSEQDANVALGMSNYVIGSLPSYKRVFVWFGGLHGDRTRGMEQMQSAAEHGHYLQPFAKVMLALAYEREHKPELAKALFAELASEYPNNPVFARELALVNNPSCCKN